MRTLWLASTALLISAGVACAQTSSSAPAPTGAVTAPSVTPSGASPGNLAPAPSPSGTAATPSSTAAATPTGGTSTSAPAPTGAVNAPRMTSQSPGNAAPAPTATSAPAPEMAATATPSKPKQHWASHSMMLPEDASARTYLHIASMAIRHHDRGVADDALSHAETRLLDRAVPQGDIAADDSPSVQSIESARKALQAGDYHAASMDTRQAATAVSGM